MQPWMPISIMLMAIALLTLQSILLFARKKRRPWAGPSPQDNKHLSYAGILNLMLGLAAFAAFFLFSSGTLILSPEYGILVAQGRLAWWWTLACILGVSVGMGLVLHAARCAQGGYPNRVLWLVCCGLVVGVLTATRMRVLNTEASSEMFRIRCIDMWNYAFLAWIVVILSEWFFTMLRERGLLHRISGAVFLLAGCGLVVTHHASSQFIYADAWTLPLWGITALVGVPVVMALVTWSCLAKTQAGRRLRLPASGLAAVAGLWAAALWTGSAPASLVPKLWSGVLYPTHWAGVAWAAWVVIIGLITTPRWYRSIREGKLDVPDVGNLGRRDDVVALIALVVMIYSISDLCHSIRLDPVWDLTLLLLSWVLLTEIISEYPLWKARGALMREIRSAEAPLRSLLSKLGKYLYTLLAPLRSLLGAKGVAGVVLTVAIVGAILVALSQIPNAGRTIVQPFTSAGLRDDDEKLGQLVSDRVVNTIGLVGEEIRPDLLVASSREGKTNWVPASGDQAADVQAALASNNVQIPGTSISVPLGFLVTPIQTPMRWLLGVRAIRGSVQKDGDHYVLLATSSTGQTWRVIEPPEGASLSPTEMRRQAVIEKLADTLAFKIISSDPSLTKLGMASSWEALPEFRQGLVEWNRFKRQRDYDALTAAIASFRKAVAEDPDFALAHYRLGQALLDDGQPGAAVDSFRDSLTVNPKFVAGHVALAETLYFFDEYSLPRPAAYPDRKPFSDNLANEIRARRREARFLLQRVIRDLRSDASLSDRAAAYVGLCRDALQRSARQQQQEGPPLRWQYVAFFYCKRAEYLYSRLPSAVREDVRVKNNEVWLLDELGLILSRTAELAPTSSATKGEEVWRCDQGSGYAPDPTKSHFNPYLKSAQKYFQQALGRQPDNPDLRCSFASVSFDLGETKSMSHLDGDDRVHLVLADRLAEGAQTAANAADKTGFYSEALDEYSAAIKLSPSNVDALNNYAYTVWEWYLSSIQGGIERPDRNVLEQAERYASRASQLTKDRVPRATHAMTQSTLGEVQLARGETGAAINTLQAIFNAQGSTPYAGSHAIFDEIRWDLTEAYVCAKPRVPGSKDELPPKARELWNKIAEHEADREHQRFPQQLKIADLQHACAQFGKAPATEMASARDPD